MLKYKYRFNISSNTQDVILYDLYVSPDLSFISGITENCDILTENDSLWVRSPYFPKDSQAKVTHSEVVKRNGYVVVPKNLPIYKTHGYDKTTREKRELYYIEYKGDTYYSVDGQSFTVNAIDYYKDSGMTVTIGDRIYVENDSLCVNDIKFKALINSNNELFLSDMVGNPYIYPKSWLEGNTITSAPTYVKKLSIGENYGKTILCKRVSYGGHLAYILYNNKKYYIENFYDSGHNIIGAGVTIDGTQYPCYCLEHTANYEIAQPYNIYDKNDYITNEFGNCAMLINGNYYMINFEASHIDSSGIICIETTYEFPPILLGDRITIHALDSNGRAIVNYDSPNEGDNGYVYSNGRKYNVIPHLCDEVVIGDAKFPIVYENNVTEPYVGLIATYMSEDGAMMNFMVTSVNSSGDTFLKKVEAVNGEWKDVYTMQENYNGTVDYVSNITYAVESHSGVIIKDKKLKVKHYERLTHEGQPDESFQYYDYVDLDFPIDYRLRVINTVGSNKILCVPDVNSAIYNDFSMKQIVLEVISSIQEVDFVIEKKENTFGVRDLYFDSWIPEALGSEENTSVYQLSNIRNNLQFNFKTSFFSLPIGLSCDMNQKTEYEDLIINQYYDDEAEKAINKLVDMEKDIYTPAFVEDGENLSLDSMVFNLHFRTRDLNTWKVIDDPGFDTNPPIEGPDSLSSVTFVQGAINGNNGADTDSGEAISAKRVKSTGEYITAPFRIDAEDDYKFFLFRYDSHSNFSYTVGPVQSIEIHDTSYRYRISVGHIDDSNNISPGSTSWSDENKELTVYVGSNQLACKIKRIDLFKDGIPLTADYQYCHYFITDYYPYYSYAHNTYKKLEIDYNVIEANIDIENGETISSSNTYLINRELYPPFKVKCKSMDYKFDVFAYNREDRSYSKEMSFKDAAGFEFLNINYVYKIVFHEPFIENGEYNYQVTAPVSDEYNSTNFGLLTDNSDLLGFMYFTTDDVKGKRDKLKGSFLRLTFFDSMNPEKQNMLGTSTLYFDCDKYFDTINEQVEKSNLFTNGTKFHYEPVAKSRQKDRVSGTTNMDVINGNTKTSPTVLNECFRIDVVPPIYGEQTRLANLVINAADDVSFWTNEGNRYKFNNSEKLKLNSQIVVYDWYSNKSNAASEGFYAYILKEFANKKLKRMSNDEDNEGIVIYMKAEFFHAGVGIKIPMVFPTKEDDGSYTAISQSGWTEDVYDDFIKGYDLESVFKRLYIPIRIKYDKEKKSFIYSIGGEDENYQNAIQRINQFDGTKNWIFNLFELKIKAQ